jgi:hypothetical protein
MASFTINTQNTKVDKSYDFDSAISDIDGLEYILGKTRSLAIEKKTSFKSKKQYHKCIIQLAHFCRDLATLRATILTLKERVNKGIQSHVTSNAFSNISELKSLILGSVTMVCVLVDFDPSHLF